MKALLLSRFLGAMALVVAGCAAPREPATILKPVGPVSLAPASKARSSGCLVAYTPIILPPLNSTTLFYPHSAYAIYDRRGALLRQVRNHLGPWDETPERILLPPGQYTVHAQADLPGELVVPITIRGGRMTIVDLAKDHRYFVTDLNPG